MKSKEGVYLSIAGVDPGWIIGKIAEDILANLKSKGVQCRYGPPDGYQGEAICYHLGYAYAKRQKDALINSVFITHIDDTFKENLVVAFKEEFDSFVCMSSEDRDYLIELGFDAKKVFGIPLPVRNDYVKPISLGVFSECYADGRKNESWLVEYVSQLDDCNKILNFVFIGPGWNAVVDSLAKQRCSFEWHYTSRITPYEYKFQQNKLLNLDYYFYLGFDGGAMGSYDAYAAGVPLMLTAQSYHLDIPEVEVKIESKSDLFTSLDSIIEAQSKRLRFFRDNSVQLYVERLTDIWTGKENEISVGSNKILEKRREHYFPFSLRRFAGSIKRKIS